MERKKVANKELDLFKEIIPSIDMGIKELYDAAGTDGKKDIKRELWNLNRYISSVKGDYEKQALAIFQVNQHYNKNWTVLGTNHPKLQWQLLCVAGETGKKEFHPWIGLKRKKDSKDKYVNLILKLYPNMKYDDAELYVKISTKKELDQLLNAHGQENLDK